MNLDSAVPVKGTQKLLIDKLIHEAGDSKIGPPNVKNTKFSISIDSVDKTDQSSFETPNQKMNNILKPRESVSEFKKSHHLQQHSSKKYIKHGDHCSIAIAESNIRSK